MTVCVEYPDMLVLKGDGDTMNFCLTVGADAKILGWDGRVLFCFGFFPHKDCHSSFSPVFPAISIYLTSPDVDVL